MVDMLRIFEQLFFFFQELTRLAHDSRVSHMQTRARARVSTHTGVITIDFSPVSLNPLDRTPAAHTRV